MIPNLSHSKIYLNVKQNQVYPTSKLHKMFRLWTAQLKSGKKSQELFDRLCLEHFENLVELPMYERIDGKRHSNLCNYADDHNCKCWCKSKFHGKKIMVETQ